MIAIDKLISARQIDDILSKMHGMYHIEDIRALISRMPSAEEYYRNLSDINSHEEETTE